MDGVVVRRAGPDDVVRLVELRRRWTVESAGDGAGDDPTWPDRFDRWWRSERDRRWFWLADAGGDAVGMANLAVFERMPRPGRDAGRWGHLANVYVVPEHRSRGIGAELVAAVLCDAQVGELERVVVNPSEASRTFWRRAGFTRAHDLLVRRPDPDPPR